VQEHEAHKPIEPQPEPVEQQPPKAATPEKTEEVPATEPKIPTDADGPKA
jgi:hypothetical protein